jgi:hypothetical protein
MTSHPPEPPQDAPRDPDLHPDTDQDEADAEAAQPGVDPDWPQTPQGSTDGADTGSGDAAGGS